MRKIWVKVDPWDKSIVTTALEGGADGILVPEKDVIFFTVKSGDDEAEILKLCQNKKVVLQCTDWTIIPLENLIAQGADVIAQVNNFQDAQTAFGILEKGVSHILFHASDALELKKALTQLHEDTAKTPLQEAEIVEITPVGMGDRVCVDTCTAMAMGEGMLVGNSSNALFLVHSESISNPYVAPRPFRVNAGAVHAYTKVPGGRTRYLSELASGDSIQIVDYQGNTSTGIVGRLKIEKRPLMLITAKVDDKEVKTILQNAETIRLTDPAGNPVSVVSLKAGDRVLVAVESGARHFGHKIEETITEK